MHRVIYAFPSVNCFEVRLEPYYYNVICEDKRDSLKNIRIPLFSSDISFLIKIYVQRSSPDGRSRTFKSIMEGRKIHPYEIHRVDT